jgi:hypothetical protein
MSDALTPEFFDREGRAPELDELLGRAAAARRRPW